METGIPTRESKQKKKKKKYKENAHCSGQGNQIPRKKQ
jgi:hypothetical protein